MEGEMVSPKGGKEGLTLRVVWGGTRLNLKSQLTHPLGLRARIRLPRVRWYNVVSDGIAWYWLSVAARTYFPGRNIKLNRRAWTVELWIQRVSAKKKKK